MSKRGQYLSLSGTHVHVLKDIPKLLMRRPTSLYITDKVAKTRASLYPNTRMGDFARRIEGNRFYGRRTIIYINVPRFVVGKRYIYTSSNMYPSCGVEKPNVSV